MRSLDHDRDLVGASRDADRIRLAARVLRVADQVVACQARIHVQPGDRYGVVVVPERSSRLLVRILDRLGLTPRVLAPEARRVRVAIVGARDEAAVQVRAPAPSPFLRERCSVSTGSRWFVGSWFV